MLVGFLVGPLEAFLEPLKLVRLQFLPKPKAESDSREPPLGAPSRCTDEVVAEIVQCGEPISLTMSQVPLAAGRQNGPS
jgi:hypothetical protein